MSRVEHLSDGVTLYLGDCLEEMGRFADGSVDACVTDPPYGLSFMGKRWDHDVPSVDVWREVFRVLKPGGHVLSFGGTRTYHRLVCAIEDAGFEIRDQIGWLFGSGFPKSHDVSKGIDKAAGTEREVVGFRKPDGSGVAGRAERDATGSHIWTGALRSSEGVTDAARQWQGWGTALKPAWEPICVARKPLEGTVAQNVQAYGTGALNVDGCRVGYQSDADKASATPQGKAVWKPGRLAGDTEGVEAQEGRRAPLIGRWPANIIHDGGDEVEGAFAAFGEKGGGFGKRGGNKSLSSYGFAEGSMQTVGFGDTGTASRFFYAAKASKADRGEGNSHPTVKPRALMAYLCRLVTPPGGVVLDPFMGSASTGIGAALEGFRFVGIERESSYFDIARSRIADAVTAQAAFPRDDGPLFSVWAEAAE